MALSIYTMIYTLALTLWPWMLCALTKAVCLFSLSLVFFFSPEKRVLYVVGSFFNVIFMGFLPLLLKSQSRQKKMGTGRDTGQTQTRIPASKTTVMPCEHVHYPLCQCSDWSC